MSSDVNVGRAKMLDEIRHFLSEERDIDPQQVHEDTCFRDLGLDSLDLAEMAMEWEQEYGVVLKDEHIAEIETFSDAIDQVLIGVPAIA
jgi:acyl carrier protein